MLPNTFLPHDTFSQNPAIRFPCFLRSIVEDGFNVRTQSCRSCRDSSTSHAAQLNTIATGNLIPIIARKLRIPAISYSYAYLSKHVADKSRFGCDGGKIECRMDIHVRRMANISDMNVQATGIAAMDRASETRPVSISDSGFGHNALNFHGRMPRLRFDRMSSKANPPYNPSV